MTKNNDRPSSDKAKSNKPEGEKKPYAALDLKATEVGKSKAPAAKKAGGTSLSTSASEKKAAGATHERDEATSRAQTEKNKPKQEPDKRARNHRNVAADRRARRAEPKKVQRETAQKKRSYHRDGPADNSSLGSIFGWLLSMLVAGTIGGLIATFGAQGDAPKRIGTLPADFSGNISEAFDHRVSALESALAIPGSGAARDLEEKISSIEQKMANRQLLDTDIQSLVPRLDKIEAQSKTLERELARNTELKISPEQLNDIERRLSLIQSAESEAGPRATGDVLRTQFEEFQSQIDQDLNEKLANAARVSDEALAGASQVGQQLADVASQSTRSTERLDALESEREELSRSITEAQEAASEVQTTLENIKDDLGERIGMLVKPEDMDEVVNPLAARVAELENNIDQFVQSEESRNASARLVLLSLELADLRRTVSQGGSFARELASVERLSHGLVNFDPLLPFSSRGVPTYETLRKEFGPLSFAMIEVTRSNANESFFGQMLRSAQSIVRVRKVDHDPEDSSVEAVVARMERALEAENIDGVLQQAEKLSEDAKAQAKDWLEKLRARQTVSKALKSVEEQIKVSFTSQPSADDPEQETNGSQAN